MALATEHRVGIPPRRPPLRLTARRVKPACGQTNPPIDHRSPNAVNCFSSVHVCLRCQNDVGISQGIGGVSQSDNIQSLVTIGSILGSASTKSPVTTEYSERERRGVRGIHAPGARDRANAPDAKLHTRDKTVYMTCETHSATRRRSTRGLGLTNRSRLSTTHSLTT